MSSMIACTECRRRKLRCDVAEVASRTAAALPIVCSRCARQGRECIVKPDQRGRRPRTSVEPSEAPPKAPMLSFSTSSETVTPLPTPLPPPAFAFKSPTTPTVVLADPLSLLAEASEAARREPAVAALQIDPFSIPMEQSARQLGLKTDPALLRQSLVKLLADVASDAVNGGDAALLDAQYFVSRPAESRRGDVGPDVDVVDQGIVDLATLNRLFAAYFELENTRTPLLDPALHTLDFCRSRSALLTSVVAFRASQRMDQEVPVRMRLRRHIDALLRQTYLANARSIELILALEILALDPRSGATLEEDRSDQTLVRAWNMGTALDFHSSTFWAVPSPETCSMTEIREIRARQRSAISLYIWDRMRSCATGGRELLQNSFLPSDVATWSTHVGATAADYFAVEIALLWRAMNETWHGVTGPLTIALGSDTIPALALQLVKQHFHTWRDRWLERCSIGGVLPGHNEIMTVHYSGLTAWALAQALPCAHLAKDDSGRQLIVAVCEMALQTCEGYVDNAANFSSAADTVPFDIALLVLYAALLLLKLYRAMGSGDGLPAILGLLNQIADTFDDQRPRPQPGPANARTGNNAIYGKHLRRVLLAAAATLPAHSINTATLAGDAQLHQPFDAGVNIDVSTNDAFSWLSAGWDVDLDWRLPGEGLNDRDGLFPWLLSSNV